MATERVRPSEALHFEPFISIPLQTRLIIGGASLNPDFHFDSVDFSNPHPINLGDLMDPSYNERTSYWSNTGISKDGQIETWANAMATQFSGRDWDEDQKAFMLGMGYDVDNFTQDTALTMYQRYFGETGNQSNLELFIGDIIASQDIQSVEDVQTLLNQTETIAWMAGIFGERTATLVTNLLEFDLQSQIHPEIYINQDLDRLNNLNEDERSLLNFVNNQLPNDSEQDYEDADEGIESYEDLIEQLIDFRTGEVTDAQFDMSEYFPALVEDVEEMVESDHPLFRSPEPKLVLSNFAYAMMDRIAKEANDINKELAFALSGVWKFNENTGKHVLIASHSVPAMDFRTARQKVVNFDPQMHRANSRKLADNLSLKEYFQSKTGYDNGDVVGMIHIHQENLGAYHRVNPSQHDFEESERKIEDGFQIYFWGVATRWRGNLDLKIFCTHRNSLGDIVHDEIPIFTEFDLYDQEEVAA